MVINFALFVRDFSFTVLYIYIYIYIHSDIELDMKQLTVKSHERNTNLWDYQSGRTVMEVEKPLPRIKMSGI